MSRPAAPAYAVRGWTLAKAGHTPEENEDAWAASPPGADPLVLAVADGATETAFARSWALALVAAVVETGTVAGAHERARRAHEAAVGAQAATLPWYAAAKAEEGAFAALLAVRLTVSGRFEAEAVGDACLFHVRGLALVAAWPFTDADAFNHRPRLLASNARAPAPLVTAGQLARGDRLLLATDALAAFFLRDGFGRLDALRHEFPTAIAHARRDGLRNDDVTLVECGMGEAK